MAIPGPLLYTAVSLRVSPVQYMYSRASPIRTVSRARNYTLRERGCTWDTGTFWAPIARSKVLYFVLIVK
eukprot:SAG31_NODE_4465_length_3209_cov_4.435691_1_plen_69_part_10